LKLSIPSKVFLGFASILAAFGLVTVFGLLRLHDLDQGLELVSSGYQRLSRTAAQLESSWRNGEQATARLLEDADGRARSALLIHAVDYQPRVARDKLSSASGVVEAIRKGPEGRRERAFLDRVEGLLLAIALKYERYVDEGQSVRRLVDAKAPSEELEAAVRKLKGVEQGLGVSIRDLSTELDNRIDQRVRHIGEEERQSALWVLVFSLVAAGIGLFVTVLAQRTLRPIGHLTEAVKALGEGRLVGPTPEGADDELGLLAREFNAMARNLAERDRQLAEKTHELLQSERLAAVGRMAAQITHEIRNPLASLSLNAELLSEQLASGDTTDVAESRSIVAAMAREVDRLAEVTEEYLRFARLPRPATALVEAGELVEEFLTFTTPELASQGIRLERRLENGSLTVRADDGQLRQVLLNLVRNARDAAGAGGTVTVSARSSGALVELEVADDGPGISEAVQERMFEPFFTTKPQGTGLGLAVVRQIVRDHGGELVCETGTGQGTRMTVRLPVAHPEAV
jgi:two-component system NtrC family sensor kinase